MSQMKMKITPAFAHTEIESGCLAASFSLVIQWILCLISFVSWSFCLIDHRNVGFQWLKSKQKWIVTYMQKKRIKLSIVFVWANSLIETQHSVDCCVMARVRCAILILGFKSNWNQFYYGKCTFRFTKVKRSYFIGSNPEIA